MRSIAALLLAAYASAAKTAQPAGVVLDNVTADTEANGEIEVQEPEVMGGDFTEDPYKWIEETSLIEADFTLDENWYGDSLDDVAMNWYDKTAMPLFTIHKEEVWGAAAAAAEAKYGPLLMTCAAGKQCRTERKAELVRELKE